eukprot:c19549_g1_i2 orf=679-864(+)
MQAKQMLEKTHGFVLVGKAELNGKNYYNQFSISFFIQPTYPQVKWINEKCGRWQLLLFVIV